MKGQQQEGEIKKRNTAFSACFSFINVLFYQHICCDSQNHLYDQKADNHLSI